MAKVLVGCPTYEGKAYLLKEYADSAKNLEHDDYDILLVDNSEGDAYAKAIAAHGLPVIRCERQANAKATLIESRNMLRKHALENGYDYFFSLEQDVVVSPDTLSRLLAHNKEYVTTIVLNLKVINGKRLPVPMVSVPWKEKPGKLRYLQMKDIKQGPLIEIAQAHLACTLLSRDILEKFPFRYDEGAFDDTCLTEDLREAGYKLWLDTTLQPKHMPDGKWKHLKNRSQTSQK